jgi:hypothetical protein
MAFSTRIYYQYGFSEIGAVKIHVHSYRKMIVWTVPIAIILLLGMGPGAYAAPTSTPLSLNINGAIVSSGNQTYTQSGGSISCSSCFGMILGSYVNSSSVLTEQVNARVDGVNASGSASLVMSGVLLNGTRFSIAGIIGIGGAIPAEAFPLGCWNGVSDTVPAGCTGQVPAFYVGEGVFLIHVTHTWTRTLVMDIQSAFLNPFGDAIVWASTDGSILVVGNYTSSAINWQGVESAGNVTGSLSTSPSATPVSGQFTLLTNAHEDLFAGTETETGTMTFFDMSPASLDVSGPYSGSSTIPKLGEQDCSSETGFPSTCTITGFASSGNFNLDPAGVVVQGSYSLQWAIPALTFTGTATAAVSGSTTTVTAPGVPEFGSGAILSVALALPLLMLMRSRMQTSRR